MDFTLRCFNGNLQKGSSFQFFILNKGLNAGKPLLQPCPNCWVIMLQSEEDWLRAYTLQTVLWHSGACRFHLLGSVIPYLRIGDMQRLLQNGFATINFDLLREGSCTLAQVLEIERLLLQNFKASQRMRRVLYARLVEKFK